VWQIALQQLFIGHGYHALGAVEADFDQLGEDHRFFDKANAF
jgi:hypothetical protein